MTTTHTFRLLSDTMTVDRIHGGELLPTDIVVGWADVAPDELPTLTVHQRWSQRQGRWLETTSYSVQKLAVGNGFDGRGFHLTKLTGDDAPTDETYDVFVARNGQDDICDCRGHVTHGHCKHVDAMRFVIERGLLDGVSESSSMSNEHLPEFDDPFAGVELTDPDELEAYVRAVNARECNDVAAARQWQADQPPITPPAGDEIPF